MQDQQEGEFLNKDLDYSPNIADDQKSSKSKKKGKKGKKKKSSKKKAKEEQEPEESDDETEVEEIQARERDEDEEPSGCLHFCFWNFREGHRFLSYFSYYNLEISRPVRFSMLIMSWYLFMAFSGFFIRAQDVRNYKSYY